jgi:type I restriction enzyme, S subunit
MDRAEFGEGEGMSEWQEYKLEDLGTLQRGRSRHRPRYAFHLYGGKYPFIQTGEIRSARKHIREYEQTYSEAGLAQSKLWEKGTLCITIAANIAELAILTFGACFPDSVLGFIPDKEKTDIDFIYYTLTHFQRELKHIGEGSVQDNINLGTFQDVLFPIPPLPEQKAIAAILSSLDDKIDLLHRQNKTLESIAETLFRQWFVEDVGEGGSDRVEGEISDLIDFNPQRKLSKGSIAPYLEMASLSTSTFSPDGWYDRKFLSGMKFLNGDTLLARITPCLENGKTAYVTFLDDNQVGWGSTEYIVMRPKENFHPFLAYTIARNTEFREYAESCLEGSSGRQRVNLEHLMNYRIKIPSEHTICEFNQVAESISLKLHFNSVQTRNLEKLRDTLLPKLMSGEVRVEL